MKAFAFVLAKDLRVGHKIYDYAHRAYDTVSYIEPSSAGEGEIFVQYKSFNDGFFEETWKEYSDYFKLDTTLMVLVESPTFSPDSAETNVYVGVEMPIRHVAKGDFIYLPDKNVYAAIDDIASPEDNMGRTREIRNFVYLPHCGKEEEDSMSGSVSILINVYGVLQHENNY